MPLIDLPLDQLKTYFGRNPRPADFDEYWTRALSELDQVDPAPVFEPAEFQTPFAECFDLWFQGVGGAKIHGKHVRPRGITKGPAVFQFHGYSTSAGDWGDKLALAAAGISVFALDCRGQGGKSMDVGGVPGNTLNGHIIRGLEGHPDKLLFRQIFLDTVQIVRAACTLSYVDENRLGALGGSQGGGLTLACAALEPRIKRAAPVYPFLCDYQRVWEMDLAKDAYAELKQWFRLFDPLHQKESEVFDKLGYIDNQHHATRIQAEVLMAVGLADTICPPSTQFAAFNRIPGKKEAVIYPDFGHEHLPGFNDRAFQFLLKL